jgi:hypothetical protein
MLSSRSSNQSELSVESSFFIQLQGASSGWFSFQPMPAMPIFCGGYAPAVWVVVVKDLTVLSASQWRRIIKIKFFRSVWRIR